MYTVNGNLFNSYMAAIAAAKAENTEVIQADNGMVRWTPPAPVSAKRMRQYRNKAAAYEAAKKNGLA